jgi:putative flavoprotein involved in K+ transport
MAAADQDVSRGGPHAGRSHAMKRTNTLIIGGGQAGLAMSRSLMERGVDHVILERGRVGERWRSERWDSLRLLTPNWQTRLPGRSYNGPDPDGFMTRNQVVELLADYARSFAAPVESSVTVTSVERDGSGYRVDTDRGSWRAVNVVIATGQCDRPFVPGFGARLSRDVVQVTPSVYRNPSDLPRGGVLVVGASATGVQLAEEIHRSGRPVTLAVGRHTRLPRQYRGRDIQWWLDAIGVWDETVDSVGDIERSRREPSLQLIGSPERRSVDLGTLRRDGVRLVGRGIEADGDRVVLARDLAESTARADSRLSRLLQRIEDYVEEHDLSAQVLPAEPPPPIAVPPAPGAIELGQEGIRTVLWATGYRRAYPWLHLPVLDARGEIRHDGGITPEPGLYALGLQFLRHRKSSFIDGVGADAAYLADHIITRQAAVHRSAA